MGAGNLAQMSLEEFEKLAGVITAKFGIQMPVDKKNMLEARIRNRLRALKVESFRDYFTFLFSPQGWQQEVVYMIDTVTTNKTEFFREAHHFTAMTNMVLPELVPLARRKGRNLLVWSAGCSSGAEPYTIAMVMEEFAKNKNMNCEYRILATDLSTEMLKIAKRGIYEASIIEPVDLNLKMKYFLRSKDPANQLVRIAPELRRKITYQRLNLMDDHFGMQKQMDIIFCRNVMIYFDRSTQKQLIAKFKQNLRHDGYLFIGHSESLAMEGSGFERKGSTLYKNVH